MKFFVFPKNLRLSRTLAQTEKSCNDSEHDDTNEWENSVERLPARIAANFFLPLLARVYKNFWQS